MLLQIGQGFELELRGFCTMYLKVGRRDWWFNLKEYIEDFSRL